MMERVRFTPAGSLRGPVETDAQAVQLGQLDLLGGAGSRPAVGGAGPGDPPPAGAFRSIDDVVDDLVDHIGNSGLEWGAWHALYVAAWHSMAAAAHLAGRDSVPPQLPEAEVAELSLFQVQAMLVRVLLEQYTWPGAITGPLRAVAAAHQVAGPGPVAQSAEPPARNGAVAGSTPAGTSEAVLDLMAALKDATR